MSLEAKSLALKEIIARYDSSWLLGDLSSLMHSGREKAKDQLGELSSPMRQLFYLAGLNISSNSDNDYNARYDPEEWSQIVHLLKEIEKEYDIIFFPDKPEDITDDWKRVREVAMPSFLTYFNQGPLNYEEQVINWIRDLFTPLDNTIENVTGLKTGDFIEFYENLDRLHQRNFQSHMTKPELLRPDWESYTKIKVSIRDNVPDFMKEFGEQRKHLYTFVADRGIIDRFYPEEIVSENLSVGKVKAILDLLSTSRGQTDYLYYTATKPGNPLFEKPILEIGGGMYQVFEVKQVIHAVETLLEQSCTKTQENTSKYTDKKGKLLENRIVELFSNFFKSDFRFHQGYYVDGCEQDLLFLWGEYAFIIEAKGYSIREPLRNPDKAFIRIKKDFESCIGYAYSQTHRVEKKFIEGSPLHINDSNGNLIEVIDTTQYTDFSIIVNIKTFGQIQCDLSTLLKLENDDDVYPWAVKLDDLEIFLLTMIAKKKKPKDFVDFLLLREKLQGKLLCSDELEICGGFLTGKFKRNQVDKVNKIGTTPEYGAIFDEQYYKTMGFKNEKYTREKQDGKHIIY